MKTQGLKAYLGFLMMNVRLKVRLKTVTKRAQLALDVFVHSIQQYIGAYTTDLDGLDTLVFTAGIGEHAAYIRSQICKNLDYLGVKIDEEKNKK